MVAKLLATAAGFYAHQFHFFVFDELMEYTNRVRSPAYAGDDLRGQFTFQLEDLRAGLASDHGMEVAHHGGIRMCSQNAAKQVMCIANVGDPVAHGFID